METLALEINEKNLKTAADVLKNGGLVAFPTETVYGLGANAFDEKAVADIFKAKGRPSDNPLIVHISDIEMAGTIAVVDERAKRVMEAFMPGALTVVLPKKSTVPTVVTAGLDTVAVRMPLSQQARQFIEACGVPVAAPSANTSSRPSPTDWETVYEDMNGKIPIILKGEKCSVGIESTVLSLVGENPVIFRPGVVTAADIFEKTGVRVEYLKADVNLKEVNSPGLRYKHYAPSCPMYLERNGDVAKVSEFIDLNRKEGKRVALIAMESVCCEIAADVAFSLGKTPDDAMKNLFSCLRNAEKQSDVIVAVYCDTSENSNGINNRIMKSCGGNLID